MDQLHAMRVFCCIVEAEGFSAAAARLDTTHSSVSRHLKQLEAELGAQLLNRTTRRFTLTAAGAQYYDACVDILGRVDAAANGVMHEAARVAGTLRVSVPLAIGTLELADWLPAFQRRYPDLRLDLSCSDRLVDLVADGFDAALRISGPLDDSSMVARTLTESEIVLVASPGYVARRGLPAAPGDLPEHELLIHAGSAAPAEWRVQPPHGDAVRIDLQGRLKTDAITATHAAALAGLGIAAFTRHTVQTELARGQLVRILPGCTLGSRFYYALHPHTRHLAPKVRAFIDHMARHYRAT